MNDIYTNMFMIELQIEPVVEAKTSRMMRVAWFIRENEGICSKYTEASQSVEVFVDDSIVIKGHKMSIVKVCCLAIYNI